MRRRLAISAATAIVLALSAPAARAQTGGSAPGGTPAASSLPTTFTAASIKVNRSGDFRRAMGPAPGGRFSAMNVPLRDLIAFAYGVTNSRATLQIVGGPSWIDSERFDVDAVVDDDTVPRTQMVPMLRALLAERFQLKAHAETREMPIYQLMTASDGRLGPGLRRSTVDCDARRAARARGTPPPPPPPPGPPVDPSTIRPTCALRQSPGRFAGDAASLTQLAEGLAPFAGRIIVDRTGQSGYFDVDLTWTPDRPAPVTDAVRTPGVDPDAAPGLFTALREQLGLRLDSARGPIDVVVIDALERLDPN
jgi:uncharacterized protein (TIGR03435 family)